MREDRYSSFPNMVLCVCCAFEEEKKSPKATAALNMLCRSTATAGSTPYHIHLVRLFESFVLQSSIGTEEGVPWHKYGR